MNEYNEIQYYAHYPINKTENYYGSFKLTQYSITNL